VRTQRQADGIFLKSITLLLALGLLAVAAFSMVCLAMSCDDSSN
jgi:hypothetical protein